MNKQDLYRAFGGAFSKSRIVPTGDEPGTYKLVAKFAEIEPLDDGPWDVWLTSTASPEAVLGTGKLNNIIAAVQAELGEDLKAHRADGEAWFTVADPMSLIPLAKVLGIRRTRHLSEEQQFAMRKQLAKVRGAA